MNARLTLWWPSMNSGQHDARLACDGLEFYLAGVRLVAAA
jgi:hypothetical protein